ncbi:MAG: flagellin, partial [Planctomycetes bacterium]|nr:flagellin [Planctomycetota bacterium]
MARINTNVSSMIAQSDLHKAGLSLNQALQRLSTGLRINRGADDPAGLIASETLRGEIAGITQAIGNSQRATNIIATTEGALGEVSSLLVNIKSLTVQAANKGAISPEEIKANQLQIDSAVESITRISNVTNFAGLNLLDGSLDYQTSGVINSQINTARIFNAQFASATSIPVSVDVLVSAQPAELRWSAVPASAVTIVVAGTKGVETIQFISNTTAGTIMSAINSIKDATGVSAAWFSGTANSAAGLRFYSTEWGSDAFVSVSALPGSGTFTAQDINGATTQRTIGRDVSATVNGSYTVGRGLTLSLNT